SAPHPDRPGRRLRPAARGAAAVTRHRSLRTSFTWLFAATLLLLYGVAATAIWENARTRARQYALLTLKAEAESVAAYLPTTSPPRDASTRRNSGRPKRRRSRFGSASCKGSACSPRRPGAPYFRSSERDRPSTRS